MLTGVICFRPVLRTIWLKAQRWEALVLRQKPESGTERNSEEGVWGQERCSPPIPQIPCPVWSLASSRVSLGAHEVGEIPGLPRPTDSASVSSDYPMT